MIADKKKTIAQYFKKNAAVLEVIIFGSQASNKATNQSDVDIAVLFQRQHVPSEMQLIDIREELSSLLKQDVDLVTMNTANPILRHQIYKNGIILLNRNKRFSRSFFVKSLMEYDDIKRVRATIEKNILKRKVHG